MQTYCSIAAITSVAPRFILLRMRPARWASIRTRISMISTCSCTRTVASPTYNAEGRIQKTESDYGDTSREGNEIGVLEPTRSEEHVACCMHAVEISCVLVPNLPCTRTRTQFHVIDSSQPYSFPARPRPTRTYVHTQKKQYT